MLCLAEVGLEKNAEGLSHKWAFSKPNFDYAKVHIHVNELCDKLSGLALRKKTLFVKKFSCSCYYMAGT